MLRCADRVELNMRVRSFLDSVKSYLDMSSTVLSSVSFAASEEKLGLISLIQPAIQNNSFRYPDNTEKIRLPVWTFVGAGVSQSRKSR